MSIVNLSIMGIKHQNIRIKISFKKTTSYKIGFCIPLIGYLFSEIKFILFRKNIYYLYSLIYLNIITKGFRS
jgi:hypothetical protein